MKKPRVCALPAAVLLLVLLATAAIAGLEFELEPGVHTFAVDSQSFEVETEVTINLTFDVVTQSFVSGSVTVLDPIGQGWVKITWLDAGAVIMDEVIEGSESFSYRNFETGHAERSRAPKHEPTTPLEPDM